MQAQPHAEYQICPVAKPRQTRSDVWKKRPCVMRYRSFADECRASGMEIPEAGAHIIFIIPMPKSWSEKRKKAMDGQPHQQTPDIDNICKSLLDSLFKNDSHIYDIRLSKFWGRNGKIIIKRDSTN
jgi:Holliday junction resolvase RusA-like endonuclease